MVMSTSSASKASRSLESTEMVLLIPPKPSSVLGSVGSCVQLPSMTNLYSCVPTGSSIIVTKAAVDEDIGINCQLLKEPLKKTCFGKRVRCISNTIGDPWLHFLWAPSNRAICVLPSLILEFFSYRISKNGGHPWCGKIEKNFLSQGHWKAISIYTSQNN